jgi:histidine phosphotransferase ChpT
MSALKELSSMDLAALVASRVCHDIISPVGAITNGLEVLDEEGVRGHARIRHGSDP